jgi:hypothetical protein
VSKAPRGNAVRSNEIVPPPPTSVRRDLDASSLMTSHRHWDFIVPEETNTSDVVASIRRPALIPPSPRQRPWSMRKDGRTPPPSVTSTRGASRGRAVCRGPRQWFYSAPDFSSPVVNADGYGRQGGVRLEGRRHRQRVSSRTPRVTTRSDALLPCYRRNGKTIERRPDIVGVGVVSTRKNFMDC